MLSSLQSLRRRFRAGAARVCCCVSVACELRPTVSSLSKGGHNDPHVPIHDTRNPPRSAVTVRSLARRLRLLENHRWTNSATGLSRKNSLLSKRTTARKRASTRGGGSGTTRRSTTTRARQPSSSEEHGGEVERESESGEEEDGGGVTLVSRSTVRKEFTPVFGTGVVFYTSGAEVKGAMLWGFPGEATAAAAAAAAVAASSKNGHHATARPAAEGTEAQESAADAAAGISARALDLLRTIMERSANMEADLSDERVMQAWVQGLSDAARVVAQETGVGHLQPMRRCGCWSKDMSSAVQRTCTPLVPRGCRHPRTRARCM